MQRRLQLASMVYNWWTDRGTDPASLAAHMLDGSVDALQDFISAPDAVKKAPHSEGAGISAGSLHCSSIPHRNAQTLSYDEFVQEYMAPNLPVMIEVLSFHWRCFHKVPMT